MRKCPLLTIMHFPFDVAGLAKHMSILQETLINSSISFGEAALTILFAILPFPLIDCAICMVKCAQTMPQAILTHLTIIDVSQSSTYEDLLSVPSDGLSTVSKSNRFFYNLEIFKKVLKN